MKKFDVPGFYRSDFFSNLKKRRKEADKLKKDFRPTHILFPGITFIVARHFGFCYGVENAIEIAYRCLDENKGRTIYLLSEMIHNPQVNADLQARGIRFLQDSYGNSLIPLHQVQPNDLVIIPAFGATVQMEEILQNKGIAVERYNTTCPFVEKVWNRGEQLGDKGYSLVIHGKPTHEETKATFSRVANHSAAMIVSDMADTELLAAYMKNESTSQAFLTHFEGKTSPGFDPERDLRYIGVINQTTQLATDTQAIADYLKTVIEQKYGIADETGKRFFADTRDTLCYATNDNQTAVRAMLEQPASFAVVVGGYNSSNTSHLVELCEHQLPTFYIKDESCISDDGSMQHFDWRNKIEVFTHRVINLNEPLTVMLTSGASCPDATVERVMQRIAKLAGVPDQFEPEVVF